VRQSKKEAIPIGVGLPKRCERWEQARDEKRRGQCGAFLDGKDEDAPSLGLPSPEHLPVEGKDVRTAPA
jgi:hypothetical protein